MKQTKALQAAGASPGTGYDLNPHFVNPTPQAQTVQATQAWVNTQLLGYATQTWVTGAFAPLVGPNFTGPIKESGIQVLTSQQVGIGATIAAYTLSGTYASDLAKLQALYNQVLALVAALKTHGLVAT